MRKFISITKKSDGILSLNRYVGKNLDCRAELDYSHPEVTTELIKEIIEKFRVLGAPSEDQRA